MDMFTHTDIFSTLHTQETWNMINLYQRLIGLIIKYSLNYVNRPKVEHNVLLILLQIIIPSKLFSVWLWHSVEKQYFYLKLSRACEVP